MVKLQNLKRFGSIYEDSTTPGNLTIFCPSCPQPDINLPPGWRNLPNWVTRRTITVDGNFHADNIKMRRPDLDVALTNGRGFMTEEKKYAEYLKVAKEPRQVSRWMHMTFLFKLMILCRGQPVGTIELATGTKVTITKTENALELLDAVAQGMGVIFRPLCATCKRENGEAFFHTWFLKNIHFLSR